MKNIDAVNTLSYLAGRNPSFKMLLDYYSTNTDEIISCKVNQNPYYKSNQYLLYYLIERPKSISNRFHQMGRRYPSVFSHLTDINDIFDIYTKQSSTIKEINYKPSDFFEQYRSELFIPCKDKRIFSHCQQHYLFTYDSTENSLSTYIKQPCY